MLQEESIELQHDCTSAVQRFDTMDLKRNETSLRCYCRGKLCLQVPRVSSRFSTFLTRFEAQQQLTEAKAILEGHLKAHQELKGSPCLSAALQLALAIGNFLNWGSRLGGAAGFRLRNLPKLQAWLLH